MNRYVAFFFSGRSDREGFYAVLDAESGQQAKGLMHYRTGRPSLPGIAAYRVCGTQVALTPKGTTIRSVDVVKKALELAGHCHDCRHPYTAAGPAGICIGCSCRAKHPVTA